MAIVSFSWQPTLYRVHEYGRGEPPMPDLAPGWLGHTCVYCGHVSGLDDWQLADMPLEMSRCPWGRWVGWWCQLLIWSRLHLLMAGGLDLRGPDLKAKT